MGDRIPCLPAFVLHVGKKNSATFFEEFGREPGCSPTVLYKGLLFFQAFQMHVDHCIPVHLTGLGCSFQFFMERNPREA